MFDGIKELIDLIGPISKVFKAILNPVETIKYFLDIVMIYTPALCSTLFLFFIVTGSRKVLSALFLTILAFMLLKATIVFELTWLTVVIVVAILIIRYMGVAM